MNKSFTLLKNSSQKFVKNHNHQVNLKSKIAFLQDYCRAYSIVKTNCIQNFELFLN